MTRRRQLLSASGAAAAALGLRGRLAGAAPAGRPARQLLELRTYHFSSPAKQAAFERFLADAGIAALNRAGVRPVGVWKLLAQDNPTLKLAADSTDLVLLLPHDSLEAALDLERRLAADPTLRRAGAAVLGAPKGDPAFTRYESTLLRAFEGFPRVQPPPKELAGAGRLFELRVYESHSEERARNKVDMFNAGEFPIFARAGMPGVFFGAAIAGPNLPQLTYMVCHRDGAEVKQAWRAFFDDPAWKALVAEPSYKDNVSKVDARFLRPAAASQI
jgi:hypothetical protein